MKSPEEFDAFLREQIVPRMRAIEDERRKVQARRDALAVPAAWKVAGSVAGFALAIFAKQFALLIVLAALPWVVEAARKLKVPDTASPLVRSQILEPVVRFWDPSFDYKQRGHIAQAEFDASRLFAGESFNRYAGEDLVTGKHGATAFRFCELHVKHVEKTKNGTRTRVVFDGIFFVADFNKSFRSQTVVLPDTAERALGTFGRAFQSLASGASGMQLVELEDPAFERAFTVRSTDPTEARYLLSPSLMQRIAAFGANTGSKLRLGFLGGRVYVAIPLPGDFLAINAHKPLMLDDIRKWAGELLFATSIVDELDLNTRIWAKKPAA
ncbi:MAG: DUF3137 domain-containing protein [Deltaproteobacteria bacterium]|nr:DUF3137 domain-containing protein [Deltaproteobacteria bacterium]